MSTFLFFGKYSRCLIGTLWKIFPTDTILSCILSAWLQGSIINAFNILSRWFVTAKKEIDKPPVKINLELLIHIVQIKLRFANFDILTENIEKTKQG